MKPDPISKPLEDMWKSLVEEKSASTKRLIEDIRKTARAAEGKRSHDA